MNDCARDQLLIDASTYARTRVIEIEAKKHTISLAELAEYSVDRDNDLADLFSALTSAHHHIKVQKVLAGVSTEDLEAALKARSSTS